jgi:hypothetical protein
MEKENEAQQRELRDREDEIAVFKKQLVGEG